MKHKLLILTRNPVAKVGIASYLSSLFGQYLIIVSTRIADLKPEDMDEVRQMQERDRRLSEELARQAAEEEAQKEAQKEARKEAQKEASAKKQKEKKS